MSAQHNDLLDDGHSGSDAQGSNAAVEGPSPTQANVHPISKGRTPGSDLLLVYADALDDLEGVRIATANRARSLTQIKGMSGTPEEVQMLGLCDAIKALEHQAELHLKRALRQHPLGAWVKRTSGVGEKQGARLLAAIGDPYWNTLHDRPRTVSELWAYCGYHVLRSGHASFDAHDGPAGADPSSGAGPSSSGTHTPSAGVAPSRQKGQKANWNSVARTRAHLVADACMKQRTSPYRKVYDAGRKQYADAVHNQECRQCGPKGKPAAAGSPLSLGHQHARALRLVAKAILRDLWVESKALHEAAA